jgi:hypothetical protein
MTEKQIVNILKQHSVPYFIQGGRILADSMLAFTPLFSETVDITNYTLYQLLSWLGY